MYGASVENMTQAAVYVPIVVTLASLAVGLDARARRFRPAGRRRSAPARWSRSWLTRATSSTRWSSSAAGSPKCRWRRRRPSGSCSLIDAAPAIRDSDDVVAATAIASAICRRDRRRRRRRRRRDRAHRAQGRDVRLWQRPTRCSIASTSRRRRGETIAIVGPPAAARARSST